MSYCYFETDIFEVKKQNDKQIVFNISDVVSSKDITLPSNIRKIEDFAFFQTYKADEIVLPESIEYYGKGVFCDTHIRKITLPSNMTIILHSICSGCEYLKTIVWNGNVREIGYAVFSGAVV